MLSGYITIATFAFQQIKLHEGTKDKETPTLIVPSHWDPVEQISAYHGGMTYTNCTDTSFTHQIKTNTPSMCAPLPEHDFQLAWSRLSPEVPTTNMLVLLDSVKREVMTYEERMNDEAYERVWLQ